MTASREHLTTEADVLIVGGGPAGLSPATTLACARRRVIVIDSGEPRNARAEGRAEAVTYGVRVVDGTVVTAKATARIAAAPSTRQDPETAAAEQRVSVTLADGALLTGRRPLVTTGLTDELPSVEGVAARFSRDVVNCPYAIS